MTKGQLTVTALEMVGATSAAVLILTLIGVPAAWSVGLKGFWRIGMAPAFAMTMIAGTAVIAPWLGVPWSIVAVGVVTAVVCGGIYAARRWLAPAAPRPTGPPAWRGHVDWWLVGALIAAATVISVQVVQVIGSPSNISQTFDNIFHLNGVRYILDEGNASPLHLGYMTSPDGTLPFYPAAWHALTSLVVQLTGVSIPIAVNAVVLTTAAFIWPVSVMLLTRTLFGSKPAVSVAAAAVSASLPAFPLLLMDYGVLYPLQLGLALLPAALAATLALLRLAPVAVPRGTGWWALTLVGVMPGMTVAHPGAFVAWLALSAPMVVTFAWRLWRRAGRGRRVIIIGGFVIYLVAGALLVRVLRPPAEARGWPLAMSMREAVLAVASVSTWYAVPAVIIAVAIIAGIVWAVVDRRRVALLAVAMYAVAAILFVTVAALPWPQLRDALTGSWYNNLPRLAAILAVTMVPLAAFGIARTTEAILAVARERGWMRKTSKSASIFAGVLAGVVLLAGLQLLVMPTAVNSARWGYVMNETSPLLSTDEYALLMRVSQHVPEGVAVAGSPWTGASLAYAISDRPVLMPHTLMNVIEEVEEINDGLDTADPGSPACDAVHDLDVGFVLDFGGQEVHGGTHAFPGFEDLADSDRVRLVDEQGVARLYEIVGCQ